MYANVFTAERRAAFQQGQLARDVERRRQIAARRPGIGAGTARPTPPTAGHRLPGLVAWFGRLHVRPA